MMIRHKQISLFLAGLTLLLSSCASPREARLARYAEYFESLPEADQEKIVRGSVEEGMSRDMVYLAWGKPARRTRGGTEGKRYEKWHYVKYEPVWRQHLGIGYGRGYGSWSGGYCGPHPYHSSRYYRRFSYSPELTYVPRTAAVVRFENGVVRSWEARD